MKNNQRYFYHSFPRPRNGESNGETVQRGWAILQSIRRLGLILAPEIVEWETLGSDGSPSPTELLQRRICFTELSTKELGEHSKRFGPFALEFDNMALRRAGALPVIYMPQALSEQDPLALLGPFTVSHLKHTEHMLTVLNKLDRFRETDTNHLNRPDAPPIAEDCMFTLRNGDESRGTLQKFHVPWSAIRDLLRFISFENAPLATMIGALSIAQSLFYPTDDAHEDGPLGYYRQREWRITADYSVNGNPRGRNLDEKEKKDLVDIDSNFWNRELNFSNETFFRVDRAVALFQPDPQEFLGMATRLIVPREVIHEARQLVGDLITEVDQMDFPS